ncbi:MAG: ABC transporter ATP-binding protein [Solirubrobacteraceae bacterium]|nr:ABC transporter ATP-binding protein [Solirubrobacteraceae bacterium]
MAPDAATAAAPALSVKGLNKHFGERHAVRDVSFDVARGELLAIIGPNGAGKTTLLTMLAGIRTPETGSVAQAPGSTARIGWVPQQTAVYTKLTVAQNLRLFAKLEKVADVDETVKRMLDQTGLGERADDELGSLSGGNRQRVNIAVGLLADPPVLLLDEPSGALDPRQRARLWGFITALTERGTAVIFATHDIAEAERHADRVLVLADGEMLFDDTPGELKAVAGADDEHDLEQAFVSFLRTRGH